MLWGATIGRTVGLPVQGALIVTLPDLLTVPVFGYYLGSRLDNVCYTSQYDCQKSPIKQLSSEKINLVFLC